MRIKFTLSPANRLLFFVLFWTILGKTDPVIAQSNDWRNINNGRIIPDKSYSDQPYIVKTDDRAWLCVMTTGSGHEGATGQHIISQRSFDQGETWEEMVEIEPEDGP